MIYSIEEQSYVRDTYIVRFFGGQSFIICWPWSNNDYEAWRERRLQGAQEMLSYAKKHTRDAGRVTEYARHLMRQSVYAKQQVQAHEAVRRYVEEEETANGD